MQISPYFGELAALGTALCWTFGSQFFEAAGTRIGSLPVNLLRLAAAFVFFALLSQVIRGTPVPLNFSLHAWLWLGLSGIIGFAFGDMFLFRAFVEIGPRISMLIMTLSAPLSAVFGLSFLHEQYFPIQWAGMFVTLAGVSWVILERPGNATKNRKVRVLTSSGVLAAFLGAVGQAGGYVLSKYGMQDKGQFLDPFAATQIRVIAGILGFLVILSFRKGWKDIYRALQYKTALGYLTAGAFLGPFLGVSLSLLALHYVTAGIAATITSLVPIFIIPSVIFIGKEHVSHRAVMGAAIAVAGVILLTLTN